ncbi:hypothetical protein DF200_04500 [Bifidobacterium catulorum]|uniref:Uncharacterized protein n=1 Tax=Bifidobacterium catulorum TaxID=1630173 RepID=A0A2U2MT44_9BIFI|nr:hypothetical protein DF200_04500 [Bifidobacterium catulorum]
MRRIDDVVVGRPFGEFRPRPLPSVDLFERGRQVDVVAGLGVQRQVAHVVVAVRADEFTGFEADLHVSIVSADVMSSRPRRHAVQVA